jgi:HK97 family phage major capsid protein
MPELKEVLDDVQKEVKSFGDNVKALKDSMEKDLKSVRDLAEKAGKDAAEGTQLKADLKALTEGVAAKHEAIEKQVKEIEAKAVKAAQDRLDEIEKKLNRVRFGGSGTGEPDSEMKSARDFHRTVLAARGELKAGTDVSDDKINFEEIKSYRPAFALYARRGDRDPQFDGKSMSVGSDPDGGYFVTPYMSPRILSIIYESSPIRQLATVETISTDAVEYPIDDGEAGGGWVGEQETRSETTTPQVGVQRIPVHELYAQPKATQKLLEDASVDIEAWLGSKIGQRFGRLEATAFVGGNGIKRPRGFLTYPNGTTRGTIEQIPSRDATDLTFDGLIKLMVALKEEYAAGAAFLMKRASVGNVMLLKDGNGQYIWRTDNQAGKPSVLLGAPVYQAADMATVGAGALAVAYGNFRQGYTIVDRLGISVLRDPFTAKPFVQFYTRKRVGGDVTNFEAIKLQVVSAA